MKHTLAQIACLTFALTSANAVTTFTEDFDSTNSNWADSLSAPLAWSATGGAPGSSPGHVSTDFAFTNANPSFGATLFRGQSGFGASGGAFVGNWIDDNALTFSTFIRHNAPVPITFSTRFASPFNFPGALAVNFAPILPNTWTQLVVTIDPTNPAFVSYEGSDFDAVFSNIGNVQIAASVPTGFESDPTAYTFQLDNATVTVPEPTTAVLALTGSFFVLRRKRVN